MRFTLLIISSTIVDVTPLHVPIYTYIYPSFKMWYFYVFLVPLVYIIFAWTTRSRKTQCFSQIVLIPYSHNIPYLYNLIRGISSMENYMRRKRYWVTFLSNYLIMNIWIVWAFVDNLKKLKKKLNQLQAVFSIT